MNIVSEEFLSVSQKVITVFSYLILAPLVILLFCLIMSISVIFFIPTLGHSWKLYKKVDHFMSGETKDETQ